MSRRNYIKTKMIHEKFMSHFCLENVNFEKGFLESGWLN